MKIDGKEWKLVPVDVTNDMGLAGDNQCIADNVWAVMLAAAPSPDIEALVEGVCRAISKRRGIDPDSEGRTLHRGERYVWWTTYEADARAVLRHLFGDET